MPVLWIVITFGIVCVLAVVSGVVVGKSAKDGAVGTVGSFWVWAVLINLWFWAWVSVIALHFISKTW